MKFLCDKCKTRYSIGDDRVRGKILKIRCKNCANVITVREGMDAGEGEGARSRPTTGAGGLVTGGTQPISRGAIVAPAPPAAAAPAPALEEEWYVSIDGVQSGPFSLGDAKKWVTAKPFDAELHCWSEGFDDWLPVDKVSHFRGLRKPPAAPPKRPSGRTAPPPIPREEKPLFAATMASLEKSASQPTLPSLAPAPTMKGPGVAAGVGPMSAKSNGTAIPSIPAIGKSTGKGTAPTPAMKPTAGAAALAAAFKTEDPGDSLTNVEAAPFNDELATAAEPAAARRITDAGPNDPFFSGARAGAAAPAAKADPFAAKSGPAKGIVQPIHYDDEDNLEIGEVSRVVKLADLAPPKPKPIAKTPTASFDRLSATGSVNRVGGMSSPNHRIGGLTGSTPRLSPSELGMNVDPSLAGLTPSGEPTADESVVARSFAQRHRRGLYALIAVSALMVAGVVALFVFVVNKDDVDNESGLGGVHSIDTSRPEDIVRKQLPPPPNAGSNAIANVIKHPYHPGGQSFNNGGAGSQDELLDGKTLKASEVEDMAAKQGEGTKRCYMRAQKGALGFEIADVKKINVTLSVNKDGTVNDVQLSDHGKDTFGQCLIARIKGWKFRESSGGTFRISLAFSAG